MIGSIQVMGHIGHGSVHWWVRWVMGHKMLLSQLCWFKRASKMVWFA